MKKIVLFVIFVFATGIAFYANAQDRGSETVVFEKGRFPRVILYHHLHQERLDDDCNACHDLFPMKKGIIKQMITQEKLRKQQVMNSKCLKCHRDRKKADLASGPTKCMGCHVKEK